MQPIVGKINYQEMPKEELDRLVREAEIARAEAVRDMFVDVLRTGWQGISLIARSVYKAFQGHFARTAH
jgi:hypothetical protein